MRIANHAAGLDGLAIRMSAREDEAFVEFARTFGPRFRAYFVRRGLTVGDAEELAVSCVTDISLKVNKYQSLRVGGFEAWVYTLARRALIDWWRARWPSEGLPEDLAAPERTDEDEESNADVVAAVNDALELLTEADRALISLRHLGRKHSYAEISEQLGITKDTARVKYLRARNRFKAILLKDVRIRRSYKQLDEADDE